MKPEKCCNETSRGICGQCNNGSQSNLSLEILLNLRSICYSEEDGMVGGYKEQKITVTYLALNMF